MLQLQRALSLIYPDQCVICDAMVTTSGGLCPICWRDTPFINGLVCDTCGVPLPGHDDSAAVHCDDCLAVRRPWLQGRAAMTYASTGKRLVLTLKHADRTDLAKPAARWMAKAGEPLLQPDTILVPIPVHWSRLFSRRYNQAAELSRAIAGQADLAHLPDALVRTKRTVKLDGMTVDERFAMLNDSIHPNPSRVTLIKDRRVCLIDDVMTSGATMTVATQALLSAGAKDVSVLALARVEKAP